MVMTEFPQQGIAREIPALPLMMPHAASQSAPMVTSHSVEPQPERGNALMGSELAQMDFVADRSANPVMMRLVAKPSVTKLQLVSSCLEELLQA